MSTDTATTTSEVLALLDLPPLAKLTDAQARGAVCVWDATEATLTGEAAIDLGERHDQRLWFPRACHHHTAERAYQALMDHAPACEQCVDDAGSCETGVGLRRLMKDGRRPA